MTSDTVATSRSSAMPRRSQRAWRMTLAQAVMELRLTIRRGENLLVTFLIPIALLVFFSTVPALAPTSGRAIDFVLPGIIALTVISTSLVSLGISTGYERSYGILKRLGGSPLPRPGLLSAKILAVVVVEAVQVGLVLAVAAGALGWSPLPGQSPAMVLGALLLGTCTFAGLGLLMAGTLRAEATLAGANGLYLLFLLLGGILVPLSGLPAEVGGFARLLPAAALSDLVRGGFGVAAGDPATPAAVLVAWAIGALALASRTFRWD